MSKLQRSRPINLLVVLGISAALASCGRGSGGASSVLPAPPISPSQISFLQPTDGSVQVSIHAQVKVGFTLPMDISSITPATFTLFRGGNQIAGSVQSDGQTATFTPAQPLASEIPYRATLTQGIRDFQGRPLATETSWTFISQDVTAPSVVSVEPQNNSIEVDLRPTIQARFSEPMDLTSFNLDSFSVVGPNGPVPGSFVLSPESALFFPQNDLEQLASFTVVLDTTLLDEEGNSLPVPYSWSFVTTEHIPPVVIALDPANLAEQIPTTTQIRADFSEELDPASVNGETFQLKNSMGDPVAGIVSYSAGRATFIPNASLEPLAEYRAKLTARIRDVRGNLMDSAVLWSFTTQLPVEGNPALLEEDDSAEASDPKLTVNPNVGAAYYVWRQKTASGKFSVFARQLDFLFGWAETQLLENDDSADAHHPQIAANPNTSAVAAVWEQKRAGDSHQRIYYSGYSPDSGVWSPPLPVSSDSGDATDPRLIWLSGAADFCVSWRQSPGDPSPFSAFAAIHHPGTGWQTPESLEANESGNVGPIEIGEDLFSGNVFATWEQVVGGRSSIFLSMRGAGPIWEAPLLVEDDDSGDALHPKLEIDPNSGAAIMIWEQQVSTDHGGDGRWSIYSRTASYFGGLSFYNPAPVLGETQGNDDARNPRISVNVNTGDILAIWEQKIPASSGGDDKFSLFSRHLAPGSYEWAGLPSLVETVATGDVRESQLAWNPAGGFIAAWGQADSTGNFHLFKSKTLGTAWEAPLRFDSYPVDASSLAWAVSPLVGGSVFATWIQNSNGLPSVWVNQFSP